MRRLHFQLDQRARNEELRRTRRLHRVPQRQPERHDREVRRVIPGHDPAAALDEPAQIRGAVDADAADVLVGHRARRVAVQDLVFGLVGKQDHVELRQVAADVVVRQVLERELVLLQQPARPALVHVREPALIQADARRAQRTRVAGSASSARNMTPSSLPCCCTTSRATPVRSSCDRRSPRRFAPAFSSRLIAFTPRLKFGDSAKPALPVPFDAAGRGRHASTMVDGSGNASITRSAVTPIWKRSS